MNWLRFLLVLIPYMQLYSDGIFVRSTGMPRAGEVAIAVRQAYLVVPYREYQALIAIGRQTQLRMRLPEFHSLNRTGDLRLGVEGVLADRRTTFWNYVVEINAGNGPDFSAGILPASSPWVYGFPELRAGAVGMHKYLSFVFHYNLIYVLKSHQKRGNNYDTEPTLGDGLTFRLTEKDTYNRLFGLNPVRSENFLYYRNFRNDALELGSSVTIARFYPWLPFAEWSAMWPFLPESQAVSVSGYITIGSGLRYFYSNSGFMEAAIYLVNSQPGVLLGLYVQF